MNRKLSKKKKKRLRDLVGYSQEKPETCENCMYFMSRIYSKETSERFPCRCSKHQFEVAQHAICDYWENPELIKGADDE